MDVFDEIREIDQKLVEHSVVRFNYSVLNPINRDEEFEKFMENRHYNPQLRYNSFDVDYHIQELENISIPKNHLLSDLLEEVRQDLLTEAKALRNIGTKKFSVEGIFPPIDLHMLEVARDILLQEKKPYEKKDKVLSEQDFASRLKEALEEYNCRGWTIIFNKDAASRVSVSAGNKRITIREGERFAEIDALRLIKHEIETHVLRSVNGSLQPLKICAVGLPEYLATEEGLAMYNEGQIGTIPQEKLIRVARQVLVSFYASKLSFAQTYALVRQYYNDNRTCFNSVIRSKRGLSDTSKPGGYIKDHCYLQGYLQIKKFVAEGGDIRNLYAGKIALRHSYLITEGVLFPAQILPKFL